MADFISQIQNIANVYQTTPSTPNAKTEQIATLISQATADSVNFSSEGQKLFQISQIDGQFETLLGLPQALTPNQQASFERLSEVAQSLFNDGSLTPASIDYDAIMKNIEKLFAGESLDDEHKKEIQHLTAELQSYLQNLSITQLFSSQDRFTTSALFNERLTAEEQADLGRISTQLNRLLFSANDERATSFLDELNALYGLSSPSLKESEELSSLFNQRNSLLTSLLLNRNLLSNYGDLL
jgi:hypothetical protein